VTSGCFLSVSAGSIPLIKEVTVLVRAVDRILGTHRLTHEYQVAA
jgi:hypothetical protein